MTTASTAIFRLASAANGKLGRMSLLTQAPAETQAETQTPTERLMQPLMTQARALLRRYGTLGPVAFAMLMGGQVERISVTPKRLPPDPEELKTALLEHLAQQSATGQWQGAAIAAHFPLEQPSPEGFEDAIIGHVEMKDGSVLQATLPYRVTGGQLGGIIPRKVVFGEIHVNNTASTLFQFS